MIEEKSHQNRVASEKRHEEYQRQRAQAEQHNPALRQDVSNRDFARLAQELRDASYKLQYADGTTDIPAVMVRLEDAMTALRKAVR